MLKLLPLWLKVLILGLIALAIWRGCLSIVEHWREQGRQEVQEQWNKSIAKQTKLIRELQAAANKVSTKIETKYVTRTNTITVKGDTIIKYRDRFVPIDSGMLSGGFRVYYDAAFKNRVPDPAEIANAAPTPVTDVADTTAVNGKLCNLAYEKVNGWQEWAREQCKLNTNGCPDAGQ